MLVFDIGNEVGTRVGLYTRTAPHRGEWVGGMSVNILEDTSVRIIIINETQ